MDISSNSAFNRSNEIYAAVLTDLKKAGHGDTLHKEPLSREDIENLCNRSFVFSIENPTGLLNKVFFEVILCLCRRGRENL